MGSSNTSDWLWPADRNPAEEIRTEMMRRRPYCELPGVEQSVGGRMTRDIPERRSPIPAESAPSGATAPPSVLNPETARRYKAEIRNLTALVDAHRLTANADGRTMCSFIEEKLTEASDALNKSDSESAWFSLFGAAKLCQSFEIQPDKAKTAIYRIKGLLGLP